MRNSKRKESVSVWYGANLHQTCRNHDTDETDSPLQLRPDVRSQWQTIKYLFNHKRRRKYDLRYEILDAVLYLLKTGCPKGYPSQRMLPGEFAPWTSVYYYFRSGRDQGLVSRLLRFVRGKLRRKLGRKTSPSAAVIDCQNVKTTAVGGERGFDGFKKIKGRKRHVVVDTLGLLLAVVVHAAHLHESLQAERVLARLEGRFPRLKVIFADQGYAGGLIALVRQVYGWVLHVVRRQEGQRGFQVLPKRWVVERSFGFESYRRLSKDYEYLPATSEAMIKLAMVRLMLNRL